MDGRFPQTIITDIDSRLRDAIRSELPNTKHIISVWSILPKTSSWFSLLLGPKYTEFRCEFEALYHLDSPEDFEYQWNQVISRFGINSDKHIPLLFSLRVSSATSYIRGCFHAQMLSASFVKSVDAFLKGFFNSQICLRSFFKQVGISSSFKNQANEDMQYMHLKTCLPVEEHARNVLTPFAFGTLQYELVSAMCYATSEMANGSYLVRHFKKTDGECLVIWIPENEQIHCSCKEFESSGILRRHALRVLIMKNYFQLPDMYFLSQWRLESSLLPLYILRMNAEWSQEFHSLTAALFTESSLSKDRFDYMRRELRKELV